MARTTPRLHIQLDVDYADNDKVIRAGEDAELLYIRALCLVKKLLTDGLITDVQVQRMHLDDPETRAKTLVEVGLWKRAPNGYRVVGWLERNNSAKEVRELSQKRRAAGSKGGRANGFDM